MSSAEAKLQTDIEQSREALDAWVREVIQWHFDPDTGCPFWLEYEPATGENPQPGSGLRLLRFQDLNRLG